MNKSFYWKYSYLLKSNFSASSPKYNIDKKKSKDFVVLKGVKW
jgi:hypothetical protein